MNQQAIPSAFHFFPTQGQHDNCQADFRGLTVWVQQQRVPHDGAHTEVRTVCLLHKPSKGDEAMAVKCEERLRELCATGPDVGHCVINTEHWEVAECGPWGAQ